MSSRRLAREQAVQILYQADLTGCEPEDALALYWKQESNDPDRDPPDPDDIETTFVHGFADATGQALVAVQSVLVEDYWRELRAGLEADGFEVVHLLLHADDATLRRRIEGDRVEAGARDWRLRHLAAYDAARPWLHATADLVLDTTDLTPDEVAGRVLGHVGWGSTEV